MDGVNSKEAILNSKVEEKVDTMDEGQQKTVSSEVNQPRSYKNGTTLIGAPLAEGILIAADSAVFDLYGKRVKPDQKKIFKLGGDPEFMDDPKYIVLAGSGSAELVNILEPCLSLNICHWHKTMKKVYTAKDCAMFSHSFLKEQTEDFGAELSEEDCAKVRKCSLIFATFESDLANEEQEDIIVDNEVFDPRRFFASAGFIKNRTHGLYLASEKGYHRKSKAFVVGAGKAKARKILKKKFSYSMGKENAVVVLEEAMLEASKSGKSGGTIRIYLIDHNNHIVRVSKKSISRLRRERQERRDADKIKEQVEDGGSFQDFIKDLLNADISDATPHGFVEDDVISYPTPHQAKSAPIKTLRFPHITCRSSHCGRTFNSEEALESHIKAKHSNDIHVLVPVSCNTCSRTFNSEKGLESHTKAKHSNVSCNTCNRKFNSEKDLECHNKVKHPTSSSAEQSKKRSAVPTQSKTRVAKRAKLAPNQNSNTRA